MSTTRNTADALTRHLQGHVVAHETAAHEVGLRLATAKLLLAGADLRITSESVVATAALLLDYERDLALGQATLADVEQPSRKQKRNVTQF
jgi:hypothetical protein